MKMTKLMAALVVVTIMMTSVVLGATTATTTTAYDLSTSTFDVETVVTGADSATKLTYVLYKGTTPDENSILYIDQADGSSKHKFTVNDIAVDDFIGSAIITNDDVTDTAITEAVGDVYKLTYGTVSNIQIVTVKVGENVYYLTSGSFIYLPVGKDVTVEVFPIAGHALATASVGTPTGNIVKFNGSYEVGETVALDLAATATEEGRFISVDANPIVDAENRTVTYIISTSGLAADEVAKVGLNLVIAGDAINVTLEDMRPASNMDGSVNKAFAIQITDTENEGLIGATYTPSISFDGNALATNGGYYVVESAE